MAVTIRSASEDDAETVVAMVAALCRHDGLPEPAFDADDFQTDGFGPEAGFTTLIAEQDGRPVGFAAYTNAYVFEWAARGCYLLQLWVEDDARGQGIGRALLKAVCRAAKARGADFLAWNTMSANAEAQRFYRGLGAETHDILSWSATGEAFDALATE